MSKTFNASLKEEQKIISFSKSKSDFIKQPKRKLYINEILANFKKRKSHEEI
jgi:hypothetical protein